MNAHPCVYRLDNHTTGEFYIGYRSRNIVPAVKDLGDTRYKMSEAKKKMSAETKRKISETKRKKNVS